MKNIKILTLPLLISSSAFAQQAPVYPANAGAYTTVQRVSQDNSLGAQTVPAQSNNIFLEYYAKQGSEFSASVFRREKNNLVKQDVSYDDLKKSVVIFFGDWCPHCHKFLTEFSRYIGTLGKSGVNVILLHVPSVDRLRNWQDPTIQDYQSVIQTLNSYGISAASNVRILLLGDRTTLSRMGISGLPVFLAVKNSKEYFRGVGDSGVSGLKLSDPTILKQFLEIWGQDEEKKVDEIHKKDKEKQTKPRTRTKRKDFHKSAVKTVKLSKVATIEAKTATEILNSVPWKVDLNLNAQ